MNNDSIKLAKDSSGVYKLRGLRFGEENSPESLPLRIGRGEISGITLTPTREYYGSYRDTSRVSPTSRYDDDIVGLDRLENSYTIDLLRGEALPWYDQIAAGIVKGGVLAATTFADGIAGNIAGILNVLGNIDKIANSDDPLREIGNQFINNPLSSVLALINESMESILPNYYTKEELEGSWTDHIFTANFIGDKFLKNMGFTIGAAYNARVTAGLASKAMGLKGVRDAFKGAVTTASGKSLNTASEIAKAYKSGDAFMDGMKLTEDLGKAAKKLKYAEWKLKLLGAVNSAMGEGRIEAINNSKQWFDYNSKLLEDNKNLDIDNIEALLYQEHPEWFSLVSTGGDNTGFTTKITSPEGIAEWEKRRMAIEEKYRDGLKKLALDRANMANVIFGANVAFLSASNLWQYGRFISGGYNTGRLAKNLVKGSIKEGFTANKNIARKQMLKAASNPFVEMNEEMSQAFFSETSGLKYASELNNFFGAKINPDAELETSDWLDAIAQGAANTYGDFNRWEEGFLGFLTGALGIPKIGFSKDAQGRKRPSISLEGELWEGIKEARNTSLEATNITDTLNKRILSPDFLNYYQGTIRHNKYQSDMEAALDKGSNFDYKNAEHSLFVSDAIMFDKAGRLQDLYEIIDDAGNVSLDDVEDIRSMTIDKNTEKSLFDGMTDQLVVDHIKKQTNDAKNKLDSYVKISNDLKTLYGENISSDHLEELTWMMTQVDDWENRTKDIINSIKTTILDKAKLVNDKFGIDINASLGNLEWMVNHMTDDNNIVDLINSIINDKNLPVEEGRNRIEALIKEKELRKRDSNLELGRRIALIRREFKNSRERLLKQKLKLQKQKDTEDNKLNLVKLVRETKKTLEDLRKKPNYRRVINKLDKEEKALEAYLNEVEQLISTKLVDDDTLEEKLNLIETEVLAFEGKLNSLTIFDKRLKSGFTFGSLMMLRPKLDEEGNIQKILEGKWKGRMLYEDTYLNAEELARILHREELDSLFSQIIALKDLLTSEEYLLVDPLNIKKISDDLIDLIKLYASRSKFIDKYTLLAENPELFTEEALKQVENVIKNIQDKEVNRISDSLSKATTIKDIREGLSTVDPTLRNVVIDRLLNSNNETLKNLMIQYKDLQEADDIISDIVTTKPLSPETISAYNIIKDALLNSNTLQEAKSIIAESLDKVDKSVADEVLDIMDTYTANQESRESTKKDKNKAKREIKKNNEGSLLDLASSQEDEESDEESDKEPPKSILDLAGKDTDEPDEVQKEEAAEAKLKKEKKTPDEILKSESLENLLKVVSGLIGIKGDENTKKVYRKIAQREIENRKNPPVHSEDGEHSEGNSETNAFSKENTLSESLRSWAVTQYNFDDLKNRDTRRAVIYNDKRVLPLLALGAFEFVDSGRLGDLFDKNEDIPIHYITVSEGVLKSTVLLAIEVTNDVIPINAITAQDDKQYQVVGTLGFNKNNSKSIDSYNDIIEALSDERGNSSSKYFVSKMTNKIKHIYSGRMVKSTNDDTVRQRPLASILHGETPHFGIYYKDGDFRTPTLSNQDEIVPLNLNNSNPREGSIWLMTKEADGRYYAKSLKIARFNSSYDLEANRDTPLIKRLESSIRDMMNPNLSQHERLLAKDDLKLILYFPDGVSISFDDESGDITITDIGTIGEGLDLDSKVEAVIDALWNSDLDLRFLVSTSKLSDSNYVLELLDSNILTTDILQLHNVNASFDMFLLDIDTGKPLEDTEPTKGHTGFKGINNNIAGDTIIHNGETYRKTEDGIYKDNLEITDQNLIDEINFIYQIREGNVNPIEGNDRLYVGTYSNGDKFGVVDYKIKKGEDLDKLLEKANKKAKLISREDFIATMTRTNDISSEVAETDFEEQPEESEKESLKKFKGLVMEKVSKEESLIPGERISLQREEQSEPKPTIELVEEKIEREILKQEDLADKGPRLSDSFDPSMTKSVEELNKDTKTFDTFARSNMMVTREVMKKLGLRKISELEEYINDSSNNLPNTDTITTLEAFTSLMETIKNCR